MGKIVGVKQTFEVINAALTAAGWNWTREAVNGVYDPCRVILTRDGGPTAAEIRRFREALAPHGLLLQTWGQRPEGGWYLHVVEWDEPPAGEVRSDAEFAARVREALGWTVRLEEAGRGRTKVSFGRPLSVPEWDRLRPVLLDGRLKVTHTEAVGADGEFRYAWVCVERDACPQAEKAVPARPAPEAAPEPGPGWGSVDTDAIWRRHDPPENPTLCVNCKHCLFLNFGDSKCKAAAANPPRMSWETGRVETPKLPLCRDVNTGGDCPHYEEKS